MKVVVLGGAGDMGSRAVEDLAISDGVERVTICDRDVTSAGRLAERLSGAPASVDVVGVDADDHDALVKALTGYDVVASALGPFHRFEAQLARAAIDAGVDYTSVCDEWQAAEQVIDELDDLAKERGRIIVTGFGASPGLSNVGVRYLANKLDRVRRVDISVYQPLDAGGGEAVLRHMFYIMTGQVAVWRNGERVMVPACSEKRRVEFPQFGEIELWNMGHSEPVTLPRFLPELEEVNFFMGYGRGAHAFVMPAKLGAFAGRRRVDMAVKLVTALDRFTRKDVPGTGAVRLDVWGDKDGRQAHHLLCGVGGMREVTGLSLSVGAQMLARRELVSDSPGVFAPEAVVLPSVFIERMKTKGLDAYEDIAMTRSLLDDDVAAGPSAQREAR